MGTSHFPTDADEHMAPVAPQVRGVIEHAVREGGARHGCSDP
ncbi:hypothetical protein ACIBL5_13165 [Streptomyces sp. NPDC050516]